MTNEPYFITCPFIPCKLNVAVLPTLIAPGVPRGTVEMHAVNNGTKTCPASLIYYPMDIPTLEMIADQFNNWQGHGWLKNETPPDLPTTAEPVHKSLRNPGRMGREPEPDSPDWYLGGRQDEEVVASNSGAPIAPVPPSTGGGPVGRGSMASIDEMAGYINSAGAEGAAARESLEAAKGALERARQAVLALGGDMSSQTLTDMQGFYYMAIGECDSAMGHIDRAHDKGQEFIARLYS